MTDVSGVERELRMMGEAMSRMVAAMERCAESMASLAISAENRDERDKAAFDRKEGQIKRQHAAELERTRVAHAAAIEPPY